MTRGGALRAISCLAAPLLQSLFFFFFFLHTYRRKMTRGGALRAISRLAAPLLQSCTKVHSFAYSPQNTTLPRTASADGNWRFRIRLFYLHDQHAPAACCMILLVSVAKHALVSQCFNSYPALEILQKRSYFIRLQKILFILNIKEIKNGFFALLS